MGREALVAKALAGGDKDFSEDPDIRAEPFGEESSSLFNIQEKKIQRLDEEIKDLQQDREQRKVLSYALFGFMCFYMFGALAAVLLCGFGLMCLSDTEQITLLTTTLADVIGIFSFVAKYLYHNK